MPAYLIFATASDGGQLTDGPAATWVLARDGTGVVVDSTTTFRTIQADEDKAGTFSASMAYHGFNTSSIVGSLAGATTLLQLFMQDRVIGVGGAWTLRCKTAPLWSGGTPVAADWDLTGGSLLATLAINATDSPNDYLSFTENSGALTAALNQSGSTYVRIIGSRLEDNNTPTVSADLYQAIYTSEDNTGTDADPRLFITLPATSDWDFLGVSDASTTASGNLTLITTGLTGLAAGDLLIAAIAARGNAAFTKPANWLDGVTAQNTGNVDVNLATSIASGRLDYIIRGASNPSFAWTRTGGDLGIGRIIAYRNDAGGITKDVNNSLTLAAAGTAVSMTGFTTTKNNALIVAVAALARSTGGDTFDAVTSPNVASTSGSNTDPGVVLTETWQKRAETGTSGGADGGLAIADAVKPTAGATGNISYVAGASARHVIMAVAFTATTAATLTATNLAVAPPIAFGTGTLAQKHVIGASSLTVTPYTLGQPAVTKVLTAVNLTTTPPVIAVVGFGGAIVAQSLTAGLPVVNATTLTQKHVIVATGFAATPPLSLGTPQLTKVLIATGKTVAIPSLGAPAMGQNFHIVPNGFTTSDLIIASGAFKQKHVFTTSFVNPSPVLGGPLFVQSGSCVAVPLVVTPVLAAGVLKQTHMLTAPDKTVASPVFGLVNPPLITRALATSNFATSAPEINAPAANLMRLLHAVNFVTLSPGFGILPEAEATGPPEVWLRHRLTRWSNDPTSDYYDDDHSQNEGPVKQAIFSNLNDDIELTVSHLTLVGRTSPERGPAEAIEVSDPLYMFDRKLWIDWSEVEQNAAAIAAEITNRTNDVASLTAAIISLTTAVNANTAAINTNAATDTAAISAHTAELVIVRRNFEKLRQIGIIPSPLSIAAAPTTTATWRNLIPLDIAVSVPVIGVPPRQLFASNLTVAVPTLSIP